MAVAIEGPAAPERPGAGTPDTALPPRVRHGRWRALVRARAQKLESNKAWRALVRACAQELESNKALGPSMSETHKRDTAKVEAPGEKLEVAERIRKQLVMAKSLANGPVGFHDWFVGGSVETAWTLGLHPAEEELVSLALTPGDDGVDLAVGSATVLDVLAHAERHGLDMKDERVLRLKQYRADAMKAMDTDHSWDDAKVRRRYPDVGMLAESVLREAHQRSDESHRSVRAFRNRLVLVGLLLLVATTGLIAMQAIWAEFPLIGFQLPQVTAEAGLQPWVWLLLVAVFGGVGGLWAAANLWMTVPRDPSPYNLPIQQGMLKIPAGAFVAVVGLMLIGGGVIQGITLDAAPAALAVAVVFGYSQQLLTTFLDRRASAILEPEAAGSEEPGT
jgi:hypothetical protein